MANLREKLAEHGFESNDDYEFQVRCLLETPTSCIRTLNIVGEGKRRKTAFANALAQALGIPHILYHDFTEQNPPPPEVILPPSQDEMGREEAPIGPLDQIVSEACAQSEGEPTVLILDQLHAADFREHIRIHNLIRERQWLVRDVGYFANSRHLLLFLISEEPIYHSIHKESFRLWISQHSQGQLLFDPKDFGMGPEAQPLFDALGELFETLGQAPTQSEFTNILNDLRLHVHTTRHLQLSLFGRAEGLDLEALGAPGLAETLSRVITTSQDLFVTEYIEVASDEPPAPN